ncbi:MAG TPA: FAD-dependent oxidoreductase [Gemmataceae bacterium]|jgi:glycine/D-amino acid oxidase-like deaminating enzyme|nr:FAD-dependent oxidoreductase [Gemmataceae bacterium]
MDLRSGAAYWRLKSGLLASYSSLHANKACDVVVVGAGITGALVADALVQEGLGVVVLDRRDVASGSTAASTSLLQAAVDTELSLLIAKVGEHVAVRTYQLGFEAIERVRQLTRELDDQCEFAAYPTLYLASDPEYVRQLLVEHECRCRHGFDVDYLNAPALADRFGLSAPAALLCHGDAVVDSYRLAHALLDRAHRRGARIFDRTTVRQVIRRHDTVVLQTETGNQVAARHAVFAAGYESSELLGQSVGSLHSTFAAISEPLTPSKSSPHNYLLWETARPYFYMRPTADGRLVIGGADEPSAKDHAEEGVIAAKARVLVEQFHALYPDIPFVIDYAWGGTFAETDDGLPFIGQSPADPHAYFALGYGGNGITMSVVAARIIADRICSRPNPDASLFEFGR